MPNILKQLGTAIRDYRDSRAPAYGGDGYALLSPDVRKSKGGMAPAAQTAGFPRSVSGYGAGGQQFQFIFGANAFSFQDTLESYSSWMRGTNLNYQLEAGDISRSSLLMPALHWLGRTMPEAPATVFTEDDEGNKTLIRKHPMLEVLRRPNPYYSGAVLWMTFAYDWNTDGNVYWYKIRNTYKQCIGLRWLPAFLVGPRPSSDPNVLVQDYVYRPDPTRQGLNTIDPADMVHFRNGIDPNNPLKGIGPIKSLYREIYVDNEAANFSAAVLRNSGLIPFILALDPKADATTFDTPAIKQSLRDQMTGDARGEPVMLSGPVKPFSIGQKASDMDLTGLRRLPEERLCAVLGLSPILLNFGAGTENSTHSNYEEAKNAAYDCNIIPTKITVAEEMRVQLLPEFSSDLAEEIGWDYSKVSVLQDDKHLERADVIAAYAAGGVPRSKVKEAFGFTVTPEDDVYNTPRGAVVAPEGDVLQPGDVIESEAGTKSLSAARKAELRKKYQKVLPAATKPIIDATTRPAA
jgi:HK97 family phage portal protein